MVTIAFKSIRVKICRPKTIVDKMFTLHDRLRNEYVDYIFNNVINFDFAYIEYSLYPIWSVYM